jgi:hypothetical protein
MHALGYNEGNSDGPHNPTPFQETAMRTTLRLALAAAVLCGVAGPLRADDRDQALALIERAIKAHGGAEALARAQVCTRSSAGTQVQPGGGGEVAFTSEVTQSLPDRIRVAMEVEKRVKALIVIDGDKGWVQSAGGGSIPLDRDRIKEMRGEAYVAWLATLVPLKKDGLTLGLAGEIKVDGKPALGVKVSGRGEPEAKLYFDQGSGLLVKVERRATEAGVPVTKEYYYSDFKDFDGAKLAGREVMTINGKKWYEVKLLTCKFLPKADDSAFARP